jgi:putative OPT family oligopeptide transporter
VLWFFAPVLCSFDGVDVLVFVPLYSLVAYMAGIVGSSNNPVSGVTLATVITACFLLLAILGPSPPDMPDLTGPAAGVMIGAVVACAAAISGDNLQDLKAGHILGSTPYKQQVMQFTGIVFPSFVLGPVVGVLIAAYGIGEPTAEHPQPLPAPQATLVGEVAQGIFDGGIPIVYVSTGLILAGVVMIADFCLYKLNSSFRLPVLAIALGLYLPLELATPIVLGGGINFLCVHTLNRWGVVSGSIESEDVATYLRRGLLFGAGAITGEALMGILLAIPIGRCWRRRCRNRCVLCVAWF